MLKIIKFLYLTGVGVATVGLAYFLISAIFGCNSLIAVKIIFSGLIPVVIGIGLALIALIRRMLI